MARGELRRRERRDRQGGLRLCVQGLLQIAIVVIVVISIRNLFIIIIIISIDRLVLIL